MADSENRKVLTTQQLRAMEEAKRAEEVNAKNTGSASGKKPRKRMKKQARRTFAGLLMASALVVCAIPVQETRASVPTSAATTWVKALNYTSNISTTGAWEPGPNGSVIDEWKSYVPLVDTDGRYPIYTTSTANNAVQYRFAFVPSENGSGTNVAVILGANTSKVENNTLTIDDKIDGFKKYSFNTSVTNLCAVSMDDSFLYYPAKAQRKDGTIGYFKVVNNEYEPLGQDATYKDIKDGYTNYKEEGTKPSGRPASETDTNDYLSTRETFKREGSNPVLNVIKTNYIVVEDGFIHDDVTDTDIPQYKWEENIDDKTYQLEESTIDQMQPCYDSTESTWNVLQDSELYYYKGTASDPDLTALGDFEVAGSNSNKQRIHDVEVWYIGRQYVEETSSGIWQIKGTVSEAEPEKGIFAGLTNVTTVNIPATMQGIGDCAFYGCQIKSVRFAENGNIRTIGNGAFANCISLSELYIPLYSQVKVIGENAFYNDYSLTGFTLPTSIYAIGDYAFSGCSGLQTVDFTSEGNANYLNAIGYRAFENCTSLTSVTFPEKFLQDSTGFTGSLAAIKNKIPINTFAGCTNLQSITIQNNVLDIADGLDPDEDEDDNHSKRGSSSDDCDIDKFVASLADPEGFYFEGNPSDSCAIYNTAKDHCISFKHIGEEIYERVVECDETPKHTNTYTVNALGEIVGMSIDPECTVVKIPEKIGKFGIRKLTSSSFAGKCNLKKVYIPSSIELIESGAFKGCHQLADVIFTQPENSALVIENGAFATQDVPFHDAKCSTHEVLDKTPYLSFTGTVSDTSAPFQYAMNPANNINNGQQTAHTYITFFSGWPSNLTVQYDYEKDKNTVVDVPKYQELKTLETKVIKIRNSDGTYTDHYLPYLTDENKTAAQNAVDNYQAYVSDPTTHEAPTQDEYDIINSALNIVLPAGIEAIKTGLFSNLDAEGKVLDSSAKADNTLSSITMYSVEEIEPYAFAGLNNDGTTGVSVQISKGLSGFYQNTTGCYTIGDYAFRNCKALNGVNIADTVTTLGLRPFMGCDNLQGVSFNDGTNFSCNNQIIYSHADGPYSKIIECLECRGSSAGNALVGPSELANVTSMAEEAFMDCDGVGQVDLSESMLAKVPERAFALMDNLGSVKLPEEYCKSIGRGAFWQTGLYYIEVPSSVTLIQPEAFANVETTDTYNGVNTKTDEKDTKDQFIKYQSNGDPTYKDQSSGHKTITAYCVEDSATDVYSDDYYYINPEYYRPQIYHNVYFWDTYDPSNPVLMDEQRVLDGASAIPPDLPEHPDKKATGWTPDYTNVVRDADVTTVYSDVLTHVVWFQSTDPNTGEITKLTDKQIIEDGKSARPPAKNPSASGYVFNGWIPDYRNIYEDGAIVAWWVAEKPENTHTVSFYDWEGKLYLDVKVADGDTLTTIPQGPARSGYTFTGWAPKDFTNITKDMTVVACYERNPDPKQSSNPSGSSSPKNSASPTPTPNNPAASVKTYTCTVSGGSGTGSYIAGQVVPINAYDMGAGQSFDRWTTSTANVAFGNATNATTYFVMPANNVAITATFKAGGKTSSGGSSNSGTSRPSSNGGNTGTSANPSATSVQVTKGGISNTGVAGATVSGSTDNFIVKVTDDQAASDIALTALQNKFGDITKVKYLPMDISLYDSTGRTKIADTQGMSVNLTLPLPDDLAPYAGNNRIASVKGGVVEDLNSRFTTVDGVPCINFTATHFSPYVIYVDTANLTESTIDYTPKTGDPIHPKWFLAIGLAGIAVVLFFKKDKKVSIPSRA